VTILAIDLTSAFGSIAVRADGKTVANRNLESPDGFAHLIYPAIEDTLRAGGVRLEAVDCFASASGPGSFTGVRVGLAAVKGLAFALGKRAAGISNLRALSLSGVTARRVVLLDARRGDVFAAVYDEHARLIAPETVTKLSAWLASLPEGEYEFIAGQGVTGLHTFTPAPQFLAETVARCAEQDGREGNWSDPAALDANYVRRSDAELLWKQP
jgi:tRNA threonylcarbamoyladenosine biosynthesis protein TsaB